MKILILYWDEINKNNNNREDNDLKFFPWIINSQFQQMVTLDIIKQKIKENLKIPKKSSIRYDEVKCSKNCKHSSHYYFYAYW